MVKKIVLFNHKGGVSKTTTTFHLGWMLAEKGKKVIMADFDPQCNLTGLCLDYKSAQDLESLYTDRPECNIKSGLSPAFESRPRPIEPIDCVKMENRENLYLIPGHIGMSDYETNLGVAQTISGSMETLQNLPGSISYLLNKTAEKYDADYILIDTSPSLGPINRNLLMTTDYFLIPTTPDFFSVMAIDSLSEIFPRWKKWANQIKQMDLFKDADYPFPDVNPKFLGIIIQNYRRRGGEEATLAFEKWFTQIETKVGTKFEKVLQENDMLLEERKYSEVTFASKKYTLSKISAFNSLIARSQDTNTPVFALTNSQMIPETGAPAQNMTERRDAFRQIFDDLAENILKLTSDV